MKTITRPDGYDRRKNPRMITAREATRDEVLGTFDSFLMLDMNGKFRHVRRNGRPKTWKTRPNDVELPVKYGFRDAFRVKMVDGKWGWSDFTLYVEVI